MNLSEYSRRPSCEVRIGRVVIGGGHPVAVQSMTNTDTNDTEASVAQIERIDRAGGKIVRLTAQGRREGENLARIVRRLRDEGFDTAVVAIGDSVEASVITAGNLLDAGISDIWAKSVSKEHARILQRIGARHIINAETDAGKRVGHLVSGNYLDYIELEGAYNVVKIHTPAHVVGYTIEDARVHERFGITVVGIKSPGKEFEYGSKELIMHRNDELIIMGKQNQIDRFLRS